MKKSKELCSLWNNEQDVQTGNVKISELHEFKGHPFGWRMIGSYLNYEEALKKREYWFH